MSLCQISMCRDAVILVIRDWISSGKHWPNLVCSIVDLATELMSVVHSTRHQEFVSEVIYVDTGQLMAVLSACAAKGEGSLHSVLWTMPVPHHHPYKLSFCHQCRTILSSDSRIQPKETGFPICVPEWHVRKAVEDRRARSVGCTTLGSPPLYLLSPLVLACLKWIAEVFIWALLYQICFSTAPPLGQRGRERPQWMRNKNMGEIFFLTHKHTHIQSWEIRTCEK